MFWIPLSCLAPVEDRPRESWVSRTQGCRVGQEWFSVAASCDQQAIQCILTLLLLSREKNKWKIIKYIWKEEEFFPCKLNYEWNKSSHITGKIILTLIIKLNYQII